MDIQFTTRVFKEGRAFVAHAIELDVSSCGGTENRAIANLKEAVYLFLEESEKIGTLDRILAEAGYTRNGGHIRGPELVSMQQVLLPLPLKNAETPPLQAGL